MWTASTPFASLLLSFISFDPLSIINTRSIAVAARVALRCCRMPAWATGFDIIHLLRICMVSSVSVSLHFAVHLSPICTLRRCRLPLQRTTSTGRVVSQSASSTIQTRCRTASVEQNAVRSYRVLISVDSSRDCEGERLLR
jgi:hypothetical protein